MSSELIKNNSVCNYNSLSTYNGTARLPFTLNNISVSYPTRDMYQVVPIFAGTGDYSAPNYDSLVKGSCFNYAGINQAYIDCSSPASSQGCNLTGGQCVVYKVRPCSGPSVVAPPSFVADPLTKQCFADYSQMPDLNAKPARYESITDCMANAGSGGSLRPPIGPMGPIAPSMGPTMAPSMMPTMAPSMAPSMMPTMMPSMAPSMMPSMAPTMVPTMAMMKPSVMPTMMPSMTPMMRK